jgi:Dimethlysulfonioproprionate lyase
LSAQSDDQNAITAIGAFLELSKGEGRHEVLMRLAEHQFDKKTCQTPEPALKPVTRYLPELLAQTARVFPAMASAIEPVVPRLRWIHSANYNDAVLGEGFLRNYAWAELVGQNGLFAGEDFKLGLLLLGPDRHYLDHYHPAPELYVPLTPGSFWKKGNGEFVERKAGELIWHPSMAVHATKTFDEPLLAIYVWTKDTATSAKLVLD